MYVKNLRLTTKNHLEIGIFSSKSSEEERTQRRQPV